MWTGVPRTLPGREALAYTCAVISLGSGLGLLWRRTARAAALVLLSYLVIWLLLVKGRFIIGAPFAASTWWTVGESAVMIATAWVLFASLSDNAEGGGRFATAKSLPVASVLYGLGLVPFGVAHFAFFERTVSMVPPWLPWHRAWASLTGVAFIMAGAAIVVGVYPRLAATLSAWQIGLFTLLVWGPVIPRGPTQADWVEIVLSWVLTTAAWVVATSYRDVPWLAVRGRPLLPLTHRAEANALGEL